MNPRIPVLALLVSLAVGGLTAAPALAAPSTTPYNRYTLKGSTTLSKLKVDYRAYLLLPKKLEDRTANGGPVLRFGPIGSCRFNLSIGAKVTARSAGETAVQHATRLQPASTPYVYAQGTRNSGAWRIVRIKGTANVRGVWVLPASLRTGQAFDSPTVPAWLELRATANEHTDECHSGGPRYVGGILAEAFGAGSGTAFSTDLPRLAGPVRLR